STQNTRIERLWVEVGSQFVRRWRAFFTRLERLHGLKIDKSEHLWLLHKLFLDAINNDCDEFREEWNLHPITGSQTNNKSPQDIRLLGQATLGIYEQDECEGVHPDTINRYYGTHGTQSVHHQNETGAGHPPDEVESDNDDMGPITEKITNDQWTEVRHEGVIVPEYNSPFSIADEIRFFEVLGQVVEQNIVPPGYHLLDDEQTNEDRSMIEILQVGRRNNKQLYISLEDPVWQYRAQLWVQALSVLIVFEEGGHFNGEYNI
ncbi:hypothetical protein BJ138DRAFT_1019195, partial [Hygrophoropsis aurantiaca]